MPLEFRRQRDGTYRDTWFGAFEVNGKRYGINLGVKIAGVPPESMSLRDKGDADYEASRATALAKLEHFVEEARRKSTATHLVEKLYEIKTGEHIKSVKLEAVADEWERIPRRRKPNARYAAQCKSALGKFVEFIRAQNPKVEELAHITRPMARGYMEAETARGVTAKTWNDTLKLLRATFKYLLPAGAINPFSDMPTQETETVFRKPFTPEELKAITDAAKDDDFIRPIIVTGMCTAMRRGDCCLLKWADVDLDRRFITVKTAKTGATVSIPIFPMLYEELQKATNQRSEARGQRSEEYVFPQAAAMYRENPDGITWRVKKVLAVALADKAESGKEKAEMGLPEVPKEEALRRGLEYIGRQENPEKRQRMETVFKLYMEHKHSKELLESAGVSKGSASNYLNEIETEIGCRIVRGRPAGGSLAAFVKNGTGLLRERREDGTRDASVRDFHSFRVTWVTIALTGGVPLELVQKVTGHKTTEIVLKHYFQPGKEAFRQALSAAMPALLTQPSTGGYGAAGERGQRMEGKAEGRRLNAEEQMVPKEQIQEIAKGMTAKSWKRDQARIVELLGRL